MTTKQYLNQVDRLNRMINNKLAEIYQLKTMACSVSVAYDGDRVSASGHKDRLGSIVAKIADKESEINSRIDMLIAKKEKIVSQIEDLDDTMEYQILFSRYIERKTFEQIADESGYSQRQTLRIHGDALTEFERKFGSIYKDVTKCH